LKKRAADVLAHFEQPGTSNAPTEAINGRLEQLRGSAPGFHNLTDYVARWLLEAGGFRPRPHPAFGRASEVLDVRGATSDGGFARNDLYTSYRLDGLALELLGSAR
jgi:hypothetical protein